MLFRSLAVKSIATFVVAPGLVKGKDHNKNQTPIPDVTIQHVKWTERPGVYSVIVVGNFSNVKKLKMSYTFDHVPLPIGYENLSVADAVKAAMKAAADFQMKQISDAQRFSSWQLP